MQMNIPEGYKQTELGVIPNDWEVQLVGQCFEISNNLRYPISEEVRKKKFGDYPYYGPTKIQGYIDEYRIEGEYALIGEDGDHFLKWRELSMTLLVKGKFNVNNHAHLVKGTKNLTQWFYYYFCHRELTPYLTRQGAGRYKLTKNALLQIPCAIPPTIEEQKAIAQSLSDVDALITECDRIITKKRNTKQGTMQQFLTGKKRLPGFSGEWEVKKLGEVAEFLDEKRIPLKDSDRAKMRGQYPYYGASGVIDYVNDYIFDDELILLGEDGDNILSRNSKLAFKVSGKIWINNHAHVLKPKLEAEINFLTEYLESLNYEQYNTGTAQPKINQKVCSSIPVILPSFSEQQAIAQILSDMDAEIAALEQKRNKYKAIKQGMMQELLTGKTRLISSS